MTGVALRKLVDVDRGNSATEVLNGKLICLFVVLSGLQNAAPVPFAEQVCVVVCARS